MNQTRLPDYHFIANRNNDKSNVPLLIESKQTMEWEGGGAMSGLLEQHDSCKLGKKELTLTYWRSVSMISMRHLTSFCESVMTRLWLMDPPGSNCIDAGSAAERQRGKCSPGIHSISGDS